MQRISSLVFVILLLITTLFSNLNVCASNLTVSSTFSQEDTTSQLPQPQNTQPLVQPSKTMQPIQPQEPTALPPGQISQPLLQPEQAQPEQNQPLPPQPQQQEQLLQTQPVQMQPSPLESPQQPQQSGEQSTALPTEPKVQEAIQNAKIDNAFLAPEIQKIVNKGELVVAMYAVDQPPFFMIDKDEKLIGFDVELATQIAEALGVKVRFNRDAQSFNDVIDIVANGKADIGISKLSYTLSRAKKVLYSKSYMTLKKTFLINRLKMAKAKGKRGADTLDKLINHHDGTIGVIANSSYVNFAKQLFPKSTPVPLNSWGLETLDMAMEGKVLAIFRDDLEILKLIRRVPDSNFHVLPVTLKDQTDPIHMIVPWDQSHFLGWINGFLDSADINLSVDSLLNRYDPYFQWANNLENHPSSTLNPPSLPAKG